MAAVDAGTQPEDSVVDDETLTAPSSPPELSYSKSSKSSDSDSLSDTDGSTDKSRNFEDVTLQEDSGQESVDCNVKPEHRPTLKRPPKRSPTIGSDAHRLRLSSLPLDTSRGNQHRPISRGAVNGAGVDLPTGRGMRRGFSSPSSATFMLHSGHRLASRSPSPAKSPAQSPQMPSLSPRASWGTPPSQSNGFGLQRRTSWQPSRKTAKQLEAEVDDNADEDLPDEAILENVPITGMPGQLQPQQALRSKTPSPQRRPPLHGLPSSHSNLHSANVPKNAKRPSAPNVLPNGKYSSPRSPRYGRPRMPHSATTGAFPGEPLSQKHRSKSWTEDLNEEARALSMALEEYAERLSTDKRGSGRSAPTSARSSATSSPPRPSFQEYRAKTSVMEIPQIQKGNIMIDPLPISKEKEAVLTRTRPSWLPPKSQKEEKRHIKEWEQMMARAVEAEKKKALQVREQEEDKEELQTNIARIWEEHVLPNWDNVLDQPRTRELWWRGVSPKERGVVWTKALGNDLGLTAASFEAALRRADELEEKISEMLPEERSKSREAAWFDAIERDVPHTFPTLDVFNHNSPVGQALAQVLKAYAMYRSDVGYVYGTHLVAGVLCLHMRAPEAFVALANMLNRPTSLAFLVHDTTSMARAYDLVLGTLRYKFGKLHSHLMSPTTNIRPEEFLDPIFRCLFAYNLPVEHVSRLWDIAAFEGDRTLIRAAVAILGKLEARLYGNREEILELIGWQNQKNWDLGTDEDFIKAVRGAGKVDGRAEAQGS